MAMVLDLARCAGCGGCVVACQMQNNTAPSVKWNTLDRCEWGEHPSAGRCYLPHACMHCDAPACVAVCPTGASYKADDGVTLVDYAECICCGSCVNACPYGARHINNDASHYFDAEKPAPYEAFGVQRSGVVEKCIFCHGRLEAGEMPACVSNCPGKARYFGDAEAPEGDFAKKLASATQVDQTGFYYVHPAGMPQDMVASRVMAKAPVAKK
jgi:Fe-S-cluster-containing dehydrogenase component